MEDTPDHFLDIEIFKIRRPLKVIPLLGDKIDIPRNKEIYDHSWKITELHMKFIGIHKLT